MRKAKPLEHYLPSKVKNLEHIIEQVGLSNDDFECKELNPEKRILSELWIEYIPNRNYDFRINYSTMSESFEVRYKPNKNDSRQTKKILHQKGTNLDNVHDEFTQWLSYVKREADVLADDNILIGYDDKTQILNAVDSFTNNFINEMKSHPDEDFTQEKEEIIREHADEVKEEIKKNPLITRKKVRELIEGFLKTTIYNAILNPDVRDRVTNFFLLAFQGIGQGLIFLLDKVKA